MKVIKNPIIVPFDVDATLVSYDVEGYDKRDLIKVGLSKKNQIWVKPIDVHVQRVKNHKASGHLIIVWSGSGYEWAQHIVEKLGLTQYVDIITVKPKWTYDDSPFDSWCKRLFLFEEKK